MKTFIKQEREKRGMMQKDLAAKLNIAPATLALYEKDRDPPIEILCHIADIFDVSLDLLVRGKEKDRPEWRSIEEIAKAFNSLSDAHLEMLAQTALALLAERRFRVQQEKEQKETQ